MASVLVTGGAGYVGSHACKALARAGHTPVSYDSLEYGHSELVKWGPLEIGEIHDRSRLRAAIEKHRPEAVMHFASYIVVGESVAKPDLYERNIVGGTGVLVETMAEAEIRTLIVSSSAAVYGNPGFGFVAEDAPCAPVNPYGASKLRMEQLLARAAKDNGLSWVALRYFNATGADPEGDTGEWHEPETHLIPLVLDVALGRAPYVTINGGDYDTPDGTCVRDFVHVCDLADAHLLAWRHCIGHKGGAAFNLGSSHGASVRDVIDTVRHVTGRIVPEKVGPRRSGDPPVLIADSRLARNVLGWSPRRADLTTQVADSWKWHLKRFGGR